MPKLSEIRNYYGLSQTDIAVYLSISVSLVKMVEAGKRELPSLAALKLVWMEQSMLGMATVANNATPVSEKPVKQLQRLRLHIIDMEVQVQKNMKELIVMQERYQKAARRATLLAELRGKELTATEKEKDDLWLDLQQTTARITLGRYGKAAQAILQWKTISLVYSIEKAQAYQKVLEQQFTGSKPGEE